MATQRIGLMDYVSAVQGRRPSQSNKRRITGNKLKELRNSHLKTGEFAKANVIKQAQAMLKDGKRLQAEILLGRNGITLVSGDNRTSFVNRWDAISKCHYRVCHNLKGSSARRENGDSMLYQKPPKPQGFPMASEYQRKREQKAEFAALTPEQRIEKYQQFDRNGK